MPRKRPKKITPRYLERSALFYLDRYDSASGNLKRVLMQKVTRSLREHGGDRAEAEGWVDALIERLLAAGVVNDDRYARQKAGSLHRRGNSTRLIQMKLSAKGLGSQSIDQAVDTLRQECVDPDLAAAIGWARRRRLGPYQRDLSARGERRQRDMAVLARRGFPYGVVRRVIDAESISELEALLEETLG